jgi:hypothetical protein
MQPLTYRHFRADDARKMLRISMSGIVGGVTAVDENGCIVAFGGVFKYYDGRHWGFFNIFDESYRTGLVIHRVAVGILGIMTRAGIRVHAICNLGHPRGEAWVAKLGFRPLRPEERDEDICDIEQDHFDRYGTEHRAYVYDRT